jgi:hypothetical protein
MGICRDVGGRGSGFEGGGMIGSLMVSVSAEESTAVGVRLVVADGVMIVVRMMSVCAQESTLRSMVVMVLIMMSYTILATCQAA